LLTVLPSGNPLVHTDDVLSELDRYTGAVVLRVPTCKQSPDDDGERLLNARAPMRDSTIHGFAIDRVYRQILFCDSRSCIRAVRGLPSHWFLHPWVLANWRRVAVLSAFVRANQQHPFRYSVLPLIRSIVALI
jgi:hypothetical protein